MNEYLTELHLHTKESSSCSEIPAKQMIETYKKEGYSTIVITDHCSKSKMDRLGNISWREKIDLSFH
jgi:histidinol phosphatase-like PHP family hydrolase